MNSYVFAAIRLGLCALFLLYGKVTWPQAGDISNTAATSLFPVTASANALTTITAKPSNEHHSEQETVLIKTHRVTQVQERMTIEHKVLHETCRYESDISTHPPARKIALTFDDGPEPGQTEYILDILERQKIPATFFVIGSKADHHQKLIQQIVASRIHLVANHSWDHPNFHDITSQAQSAEVLNTDRLIKKLDMPKLFRYPYGNSSCETNALLHQEGYHIVGWHVDTCDWAYDKEGKVTDREAISCGVLATNRQDYVQHVLSTVQAQNGGIILMHEIHPHTLQKLEEIIVKLKDKGYIFVSLTDDEFKSAMR